MRLDEIRSKDDADLDVVLEKHRRQLFDFRVKTGMGEGVGPHEARVIKRTISRILTVLAERKQGIRGEVPHLSE